MNKNDPNNTILRSPRVDQADDDEAAEFYQKLISESQDANGDATGLL